MSSKSRRSSKKQSRSRVSSSTGATKRVPNSMGLKSLVKLYRMFSSAVLRVVNSKFVLTLPLMLLMASNLTDYLILLNPFDSSGLLFFTALPVPIEDARREGAEALKRTLQAGLYLFALILCLINWRAVYRYFAQNPHLVVLFALLVLSATYSVEPTKVVTNSILIVISVLLPLLFVIGQRNILDNLQVFFLVFLAPIFISHLASLILLFYNGANPFSLIMSTTRYAGFSGNPNALGNSASLGLWAAVALIVSPRIASKWRVVGGLAIPLFVCSIAMSGSGTATVASILVVALMIWMRALALFRPTVRFVVNGFSAALFVCLMLSVLLLVSPAEIFVAFTGSLGKDATLTGRTELWGLAKDAITERPWFGWGFDSHASLFAERKYDVRYNHYHNGFMDTMIDGGIFVIGLVAYNLGLFAWRFIKVFERNDRAFALLVPLILVIILNMSEYSLLRPLSEIWQLYMACFVVLTYKHRERSMDNRLPSKSSRRKRSKPAMRWA